MISIALRTTMCIGSNVRNNTSPGTSTSESTLTSHCWGLNWTLNSSHLTVLQQADNTSEWICISDRRVLRCNMLRSINAYMHTSPARRRWRWRWRCWRWHSPQSLSPSIRCGLPLSSRPSNAESGRSLAAAASAPIARKRVEEAHRAFRLR